MTEDGGARTEADLLAQANDQVALMAAQADFASALNASIDLDDVVKSAAALMRQVFGIDQLAVIVVGPQADLIGIRNDRADPNVVEHFSISGGERVLLNAFTAGETELRDEGDDHQGVADVVGHGELKSFVTMPLQSSHGLAGALLAGSTSIGQSSQYGGEILKDAASEMGTAIERVVSFEKSRMQAITDPLTELYNRRYFTEALRNEVRKANRLGYPLGLFMIDIDHFKLVNDTYGHIAGDEVLTRVARTIEDSVRASDVVARYGGEEFAVILVGCPPSDLEVLAEKTRLAVDGAEMPHASDDDRSVTISLGAASYQDMTMDAEGLIDCADQALMEAKRSGRNRVVVGDTLAA
jgi:two-component system, cell cycle response regulator